MDGIDAIKNELNMGSDPAQGFLGNAQKGGYVLKGHFLQNVRLVKK